jgi:hypothetical protein
LKVKPILSSAIVLLSAFFIAFAFQSQASAEPTLWISGTPASGQFNNGLISPTGAGTVEASAKLYYLASSQPTSRPRVGLTLRGAGFEPNKSVGFGIEGKQNEPTEPWGTGKQSMPPPIVTDDNGEFECSVSFSRASPSSYNKFSGGEQLIIYPTYPDSASDANPEGRIDGVSVTLTITPTVIVLPRTLDRITMYAGADYSFSGGDDGGLARMIIDDSSRQVRLAVAGMSLVGPGNTQLPRVNGAWQLPGGVTASANADSSYIILRTPKEGAAAGQNGTFSVSGTGVSVVDDGFASVIGFPKTGESPIATFNLQVTKSGRGITPQHGSVVFTNNTEANTSISLKRRRPTSP